MPALQSREIGIALDMAGCPNRCRHCWLGNAPNRRVSPDTLRDVCARFREWVSAGEERPYFEQVHVSSWFREPDFAANYRELWQLEQELSTTGAAQRYELLSIWRLAHDKEYARWAREIGTEICQLSLFGLEANTDYFLRRPGAFRDILLATERLLEAGIRPRWQLFFTERIIAEWDGLLALISEMKLEERCRQLGHEFTVFVNLPSPSGEAFHIESLRPTVEAFATIPRYFVEKTLRHFTATTLEECLGAAEGDLVAQLSKRQTPCANDPGKLYFFVTPELDVYPNYDELTPWWRLGNLHTDGVGEIIRRYLADEIPGLWANYHLPVSELAGRYGRRDSRYVYAECDLLTRWQHLWVAEHWQA